MLLSIFPVFTFVCSSTFSFQLNEKLIIRHIIVETLCENHVGSNLQILEAEGMLVPDELSCILQLVSEHLKEPCPITNLSGTQGPAQQEGIAQPTGNLRKASGRRQAHQVNATHKELSTAMNGKSSLLNYRQGSNVKQDSGSECCLSLCQAVSFLPTAEEDEEIMVRKEDGSGRGTDI